MIIINVTSTLNIEKYRILQNPKQLLRPVAFDVLALMEERIHEQGKAANGSQIGTYNNDYLKLRQAKHKRSADTKIIVSLTRQLQNDWSVLATPNGWGIGFKNSHNADKMKWVEAIKKKKIAVMSPYEKSYAVDKFQRELNKAINA